MSVRALLATRSRRKTIIPRSHSAPTIIRYVGVFLSCAALLNALGVSSASAADAPAVSLARIERDREVVRNPAGVRLSRPGGTVFPTTPCCGQPLPNPVTIQTMDHITVVLRGGNSTATIGPGTVATVFWTGKFEKIFMQRGTVRVDDSTGFFANLATRSITLSHHTTIFTLVARGNMVTVDVPEGSVIATETISSTNRADNSETGTGNAGRDGTASGESAQVVRTDPLSSKGTSSITYRTDDPANLDLLSKDEAGTAAGDANAEFNLGARYEHGHGVPRDYAQARRYLELAAAQGYAPAQNNLGYLYHQGQGVPQDYARARRYFELAATKDYAAAQNNLGWLYDKGHGVPQDYAQARHYYELAAAQGYAVAQNNLGWLYDNGHGVPQEYAQARHYYELAAAQGYAAAQNNLGLLYILGNGVPQDYARARDYLALAAAQGYATAQTNLGTLYAGALGIPEKARYYYELAAAQGYAKAENNLGYLYEHGLGVPKDLPKALHYYELAAAQGDAEAIAALARVKAELGLPP